MKRKILIVTGGGDCPGLNAVIRAICKRAWQEAGVEVYGSIEAYNGIMNEPMKIIELTPENISGIHVKGGTILKTTNKGGPFNWPVRTNDGWKTVDLSDELIKKLSYYGFDCVISIGGDGSQKISQKLYEKGVNIIGIPKTIDNDLSCTDFTFGFQTAVEIATDAVDKLVTTAASHNRVMVLETMGRDAGWIALSAGIAGGAEVILIPEIPYDVEKVAKRLNERIDSGKGFAIIVIAEGAKSISTGKYYVKNRNDLGYKNQLLSAVGGELAHTLSDIVNADFRTTILGHLQRGGTPIAYDRILSAQFGIKAVELFLENKFGQMVSYKHPELVSVPIAEAIKEYNVIKPDSYLLKTARGLGICLGD
ncbi:ATP-dependent 6-phosphofructokinase [bacterium]|nr:ATP-dependent 6-phosphofructokinase [bacterium]